MSGQAYPATWVTESLAVGGAPMSNEQLESINSQGISAILNLCEEYCDLHEIEADYGFEVYYLPIEDEKSPEMQSMDQALDWLDECIYLKKKVLIHCKHGIGRTGTLLNAYLLRKGLGHKKAWQTLRNLRSKPSNFDQWWTIRKFGRQCGSLKIRQPSLIFPESLDLAPFLEEYDNTAFQLQKKMQTLGVQGLCGVKKFEGCNSFFDLGLAESVFVLENLNRTLSRENRTKVVEASLLLSSTPESQFQCPLLIDGQCSILHFRPVRCLVYDLDDIIKQELLVQAELEIDAISQKIAHELGVDKETQLTPFKLNDVCSGKFVQQIFHFMLKSGSQSTS